MSYARQMVDSYPRVPDVEAGLLAATIDALNDCSQACTADADADLGDQDLPNMVECIRLCLDCVDVCAATVRVTSRQTEYDHKVTKSCGDECERHARLVDGFRDGFCR